jgi:hypothetical protein
MSYVIVINGTRHTVTTDSRGREVYDPPLDRAFEKKCEKRFKEMLESRAPPRCMTDDVFFGGPGRRTLLDQFDGDEYGVNELVQAARKRGYNPSPFDTYVDTIADGLGDPEAFVSTGGRGHIRRVCEKRGLGCRGAVNLEPRAPDRDYIKEPKVALAEDIVQEEMTRMKKDPKNASKKEGELRDQIISKHALKL